MLLIVSLVALAVRRLRIPYTVALVVVGLLITFQQPLEIDLYAGTDFVACLFRRLFLKRRFIWNSNVCAKTGCRLSGWRFRAFCDDVYCRRDCFVGRGNFADERFGFRRVDRGDRSGGGRFACLRRLGAPKRLTTLVESESLFNDGTAIVIFKLLLAVALSAVAGNADGAHGSDSFDFLTATVDFFRVSAGGLLVGIGLGWIIAQIIARVDDYLIETMLTTVLAFGAYLVAERFHVSGVLAVVAAGIITGNIGLKGMSPTTRIVLFNFWEFLAFVANSLVFLLIGLDVNLREIGANIVPIAIALVAVLLSRALVVYGLTALTNLRTAK